MPVTLEQITTPDEQDLIDLEKIYADYPTQLRWPQLQEQLAQTPAITLYAARFNSRLLGAITAQRLSDNTLKLDHLCVRKVTRGRHVGRDLLRLLLHKTGNVPCRMTLCIADASSEKLLQQAGFAHDGESFLRPAD